MAAANSLFFNPSPPFSLRPSSPKKNPKSSGLPITCGPRDNRGPLHRGRTLSTEAILAVQSLKRARGDESKLDRILSSTLLRLIKADLLAALAELQRQDQWRLALKVFASARREPWYKTDCALYADMAAALARSGMAAEIDLLVADLIEESDRGGEISADDLRGPGRLLKALVAAGKGKAVGDVYGMMKRGGCVPNEFMFKLLIRGLRRLGEEEAAEEVEKDYEVWLEGGVGIQPLPV